MSRRDDSRAKRIKVAADQMWKALLLGHTFEIGAALSTDDDTTRAMLILRKKHPEVIVTMLQSRSIVLTLGRGAKVSDGAWGQLEKGGYFPDAHLSPELMFARHAQFMRHADVDPEEATRKALDEDRERNRVTLVSESTPASGKTPPAFGGTGQ